MSFISELKRRNVFRVAITYGAVGWLLVEVASVLFPTFEAPAWVMKVFATIIILGFPLALFFAWAFDLTPDGLKKEKDVDRSLSIASQTGRKLDYVIISVLTVALSFFAYDKFVLSPGREVASIEAGIQSAKEKTADQVEVTVATEKSIAVLPFENMSQDQANVPFVIGIHDDLLTHLSNRISKSLKNGPPLDAPFADSANVTPKPLKKKRPDHRCMIIESPLTRRERRTRFL